MTEGLVPRSDMTEKEFGAVFGKLAIQLRWADADEIAVRSYYEALKQYPLAIVRASAQGFATEAGRRFFPTTGEWVEAAQAAMTAQLREVVTAPRAEPWRFECDGCDDTGWQPHECDGSTLCGRRNTHAAHTYVTVCPCRPMNRTYQRHQKFGAGA